MSSFHRRHLGPDEHQVALMLKEQGLSDITQVPEKVIPKDLLNKKPFFEEDPISEQDCLKRASQLGQKNKIFKNFLGQGYFGCHTPSVITRNILENPGWYTAYTPYQAEISQGRLEMLLNFQTLICDLTGMEITNASLLDEATASAEAALMGLKVSSCKSLQKSIFLDVSLNPKHQDMIKTRMQYLDVPLQVGSVLEFTNWEHSPLVFMVQNPSTRGELKDYSEFIKKAHAHKAIVVMGCDLLALTLIKNPAQMDADIVYGTTQRLGMPLCMGGPHAAFLSCRKAYIRQVPGRLIGVSKDRFGKTAYRMTLQTREQHIRRDKATSNICTAQALPAVASTAYAIYHGGEGLRNIASHVYQLTHHFHKLLKKKGFCLNKTFFDTLCVSLPSPNEAQAIYQRALSLECNVYHNQNDIQVSFDETHSLEDIQLLCQAFDIDFEDSVLEKSSPPLELQNQRSEILLHPVFSSHHSETNLLRYLKKLENKDLSLTHSMIPLGSCTMKLNSATEMIPITDPCWTLLHPLAPAEQTEGYAEMAKELKAQLCALTGFHKFTLQPQSGAQGEYTGLLMIRKYHISRGDKKRNICLIPASAHGTNPASTTLAGLKVVLVKCLENGNIDLEDLKTQAETHSAHLAACMITYPSTYGIFEAHIKTICDIIHQQGGLVYMDGANMNAFVGYLRPQEIGVDVAHVNLHKTFCIPHGGGGPGSGPVGVGEKLAPFLPEEPDGVGAVSGAPLGNAGVLIISWAYIKMMGGQGLRRATEVALLNANYVAQKLSTCYKVLHTDAQGWVAHECIIDVRPFLQCGLTVDDFAKRLMDYGFHAPTMSWPLPGTLMIEPTESEDQKQLDEFCKAMISIFKEAKEVQEGQVSAEESVLRMAPHPYHEVTSSKWNHPYSREKAALPFKSLEENKFWPSVGRIDQAEGDRNPFCVCPDISIYQ